MGVNTNLQHDNISQIQNFKNYSLTNFFNININIYFIFRATTCLYGGVNRKNFKL